MPKVLILEDDVFLGNVYASRLNKVGVDCEVLNTYTDIISKIENLKPDAIILDLVLPKGSGFDALKKIKTDQISKKIPVIVVTQDASDSGKVRCLKLGVDSYVVKFDLTFVDVIEVLKPFLTIPL